MIVAATLTEIGRPDGSERCRCLRRAAPETLLPGDGLAIETLGAAVVLEERVSRSKEILTSEASMRLPPRLRSKNKCRPVGARLPSGSGA